MEKDEYLWVQVYIRENDKTSIFMEQFFAKTEFSRLATDLENLQDGSSPFGNYKCYGRTEKDRPCEECTTVIRLDQVVGVHASPVRAGLLFTAT